MTDLLIDTSGSVTTLTIHRVAKKNSFTTAMYAGMADALDQAQADAAVRVLVIQGHETIFSAGNDIADFLQTRPPRWTRRSFVSCAPSAASPSPSWRRCAARPWALAPRCCFIATWSMPATMPPFPCRLSIWGSARKLLQSLLAPQRMGYGRAAEALLLGEPFMAEAALEMGLVSRIVPPAEVNALAQRQAQKLAAKPMASLLATKRLMKQGQASLVAERMAEEGTLFGRMLAEPAAQ